MFPKTPKIIMFDKVKTLAQSLYNAYGNSANWKNFQNNPMPSWDDLPKAIKDHWSAVAKHLLSQCPASQADIEALFKKSVPEIKENTLKGQDVINKALGK